MAPSLAPWTPVVGDCVRLHNTRIIGTVMRLEIADGSRHVVLKVQMVVGKKQSSRMSRAWRGGWVTCDPELLQPYADLAVA